MQGMEPNGSLERERLVKRSYSATSFTVPRSVKYTGLRTRILESLITAKHSVDHGFVRKLLKALLSFLHNIAAILFLVIAAPILLVTFCCLQLSRLCQTLLVKRNHKNAEICDDFNARISPSSCNELDLVTSLVWIKGHLDLQVIRTGLETRIVMPSSPLLHLRRKLTSRYRILVWERLGRRFNIDQHLIVAPSKHHGKLMTDEPLTELSGYSLLQKYVGHIVSQPLDPSKSPWKITIIPLAYATSDGPQNMSVVVLRFHRLLLKEKAVIQMFLSSLGQKKSMELEFSENLVSKHVLSPPDPKEDQKARNKIYSSGVNFSEKSKLFWETTLHGVQSLFLDIDGWITLRKRQSEFHSRIDIGKLLMSDISNIVVATRLPVIYQTVRLCLFDLFQTILALFYVPKILLRIFLSRRSLARYGFYKADDKMREKCVSWSRLIPSHILSDIKEKTDNADEAASILSALGLALQDYYRQNFLRNPQHVGAILTTPGLQRCKTVQIPTNNGNTQVIQDINNVDEQLSSFSEWKQMSVSFLLKYSSSVLPRWMSYLLVQRICSYYPIHVSVIDTQSNFPHFTFWGHSVEDFAFWRPPESNLCISITVVKYAGNFRVSVHSPMKSLDSLLSHRFPQYLNYIAESVGVGRSRIPYSRKTSPMSSNTSSPMPQNTELADALLRNFAFTDNGSTALHNRRRTKSCQSLW